MQVDVVTQIEIARPRPEVAAFVMDPDNATKWYRNIRRVEWRSEPPLRIGSLIAFEARFLGRTISYTYEIKELVPNERLVMATMEGPFAMETTYIWSDSRAGTLMQLRNRGEPSGFSKVGAPMMASAMKRANTKDLEQLKQILERSAAR